MNVNAFKNYILIVQNAFLTDPISIFANFYNLLTILCKDSQTAASALLSGVSMISHWNFVQKATFVNENPQTRIRRKGQGHTSIKRSAVNDIRFDLPFLPI